MYAKVFAQIFDSSIAENYRVRHVFMDLLTLARSDGVIDMTAEAIARRTNVPVEEVAMAIAELEKPDQHSRSKVKGGARLAKLDKHRNWGWRIVNYATYRRIASEFERRLVDRTRKQNYRVTGSSSMPVVLDTFGQDGTTAESGPSPSPSPSPYIKDRDRGTGEESSPVELPPDFPKDEASAIAACSTCGVPDDFVIASWNYAAGRGGRDKDGVPIRRFSNHIKAIWNFRQNALNEKKILNGSPIRSILDLKTIMQAKDSQAAQLKAKSCSQVAMGDVWNNEKDRKQYFALRKEIKNLNIQIAGMA